MCKRWSDGQLQMHFNDSHCTINRTNPLATQIVLFERFKFIMVDFCSFPSISVSKYDYRSNPISIVGIGHFHFY